MSQFTLFYCCRQFTIFLHDDADDYVVVHRLFSERGHQQSVEPLPEVDLVSLVEERLPRYRLQSDVVTDFVGYSNADWTVQTPCLKLHDDFSFPAKFIEETLKYFGNSKYGNFAVVIFFSLFLRH